MARSLFLLGLLLASAPLIRAEEEDAVVVITKDNFKEKIGGSAFALVSVGLDRNAVVGHPAAWAALSFMRVESRSRAWLKHVMAAIKRHMRASQRKGAPHRCLGLTFAPRSAHWPRPLPD